jgi:hypothetical protein
MTKKECSRCCRTLDTKVMKMDRFGNNRFWQCDRSKNTAVWVQCLDLDPDEIHFPQYYGDLDKIHRKNMVDNGVAKLKRWLDAGEIDKVEYENLLVMIND